VVSNDPLISAITACYNGSAFLESSVRSAIENHPATEVIVVDDGSTDDSLTHAASLARQFPGRVLAISQANQGPAGARNTGIRLARGKYLCFLDVDDQHAPGFLQAAVDVLERDPRAVGVSCQIELLNAHRKVEDWQREAMEYSGPCNLVMRTAVVRRIGGFSTDPAFRGEAGGEDQCFRRALLQFGAVPKIEHPFFRYRMRQGSYIDLFLDRIERVDGKLRAKYPTKEEQDGSMQAATLRYQKDVTSRLLDRKLENLKESTAAVAEFQQIVPSLAMLPGETSAVECHCLNWLAQNWPIDGQIASAGPADGKALYAMASARKDVTAAGFIPSVAEALARMGAGNSVEFRAEAPDQLATNWQGRVRMLYIASGQSQPQLEGIVTAWLPHITIFGLAVFHAPLNQPQVASYLRTLRTASGAWTELLKVQNLVLFQKN
jgi:hypothetical protein